MKRDEISLYAPGIGADMKLISYGHYGRPVIAFPSQQGVPQDWENLGMIGAIASLLEEGRAKVYCVDNFDSFSWQANGVTLEEKAQRHRLYEEWIVEQVVPFIYDDCAGWQDIILTGASFGAFHSVNFAFKRADLFPIAIGMSGVYDVTAVGNGFAGDAVYFNNPMHYVQHMGGDHLDWIRSRILLLLVCGQGQWEDTAGSLQSTKAFAEICAHKGIPHELHLWGHDIPHDWDSWRKQIAYYLPRFC